MRISQVVLVVKNPPAKRGDLRDGGSIPGDPLEEGMATHSSILAWETPWIESVVGYSLLLLSRFSRVRLCATP